jgi:hypothetical protein
VPSAAPAPTRPAWRILAATATGASHTSNGWPHQDAVASRPVPGPDAVGLPLVVAVADGHGHPRHFRSARGARLAVDVGCDLGRRFGTELAAADGPAAVLAALRDALVPLLLAEWTARVSDDLAALPVTAPELAAAGADPDQAGLIAYGSTLLVAIAAGQWIGCAQIGDGDVVAIGAGGDTWAPVPGDALLDGYHTTSLCQEDAVELFRCGVIPWAERPIAALALCTDGYGNAQAAEPWQPAFGADLARLLDERGIDWVAEELPRWVGLCASAQGSGDDTTVALLVGPRLADDGPGANGNGAGDG